MLPDAAFGGILIVHVHMEEALRRKSLLVVCRDCQSIIPPTTNACSLQINVGSRRLRDVNIMLTLAR